VKQPCDVGRIGRHAGGREYTQAFPPDPVQLDECRRTAMSDSSFPFRPFM
jgi:hypothetical protein